MITVLEFASNHSAPVRAIIQSVARRRVEAEGRTLQARYDRAEIKRNARADIFVVIDFTGSIAAGLKLDPDSKAFQTIILGPTGKVLQRWTNIPTREELDAVLKHPSQ